MRVLMFSWEYPPLLYGGLGRHVHGLAGALARQGHDVVVVTQSHPDAPADSTVDGVRVLRTSTEREPDLGAGIVEWVGDLNTSFSQTVASSLAGWQPDVVHGHDWLVTQASIKAATTHGRPLVATIHATAHGQYQGDLSKPRTLGRHNAEVRLVARADRTVVCSEAMRAEVAEALGIGRDTATVIPNGVDSQLWESSPAQRSAVREGLGIAADTPLIVLPGRLKAFKGGHDALDALAIIRRRHPQAQLVFAGEGEYEQHLRAHAERLGVADSVTFVGHVSTSYLAQLLGAADAAALPSHYEPFNLMRLEAAAAGTAVVATKVGGMQETVTHGQTGLLVPPHAPDELAAQVLRVLDDGELNERIVDNARADVIARFSWDAVAAATATEYDQAGRSAAAAAVPAHGHARATAAGQPGTSTSVAHNATTDRLLSGVIDTLKAADQVTLNQFQAVLAIVGRNCQALAAPWATVPGTQSIVATVERSRAAITREVIDARDGVRDVIEAQRIAVFDTRQRGRGGKSVPTIVGPVSIPLNVNRAEIRAALEPIRTLLPESLVALDYDGTLADMLPFNRPEETVGLPYTTAYLQELVARVRRVAIITGRPVDQVVRVAHLATVPGLVVVGSDGLWRWEAGQPLRPEPHPAIPDALARGHEAVAAVASDHPGVYLEDKTLAVAMHAMADDQISAQARLFEAAHGIADDLGLEVFAGHGYVEIRPTGAGKGLALRREVETSGARAVVFGGDQGNDGPAFDELSVIERELQVPGVGVFVDSPSSAPELRQRANLVVPGATGLHQVIREIIDLTPVRYAA